MSSIPSSEVSRAPHKLMSPSASVEPSVSRPRQAGTASSVKVRQRAAATPETEPALARWSGAGTPWRRPPLWLIVLAASYLALPLILFMVTWLDAVTYPALLLLLVTMAVGFRFQAGRRGAVSGSSCAVAVFAGCGLVKLSGVLGSPFAMKVDWAKHAAIMNTLSGAAWPTQLPDGGVLRYYTGFYLVPSAAARLLHADPRLLLGIWFAIGMAIGLALLIGALPLWLAAPALLIFVLASGWDAVGCLLTGELQCSSEHQERWSGAIPVNAVITGVLWRPSQILPALILVPLIMTLRSSRRAMWLLVPLLVSCAYWGPFVAIGLTPLLLHGVAPVIRARNWPGLAKDWILPFLLLSPAALLLVLYLKAGAEQVPVTMLWSYPDATVHPWSFLWGLVIAIEVLPLVLLPALSRGGVTGVHRTSLVFTCVVMLIVYGVYSDLTINATLPFVVLFGWETAYFAAQLAVGRREVVGSSGTPSGRTGKASILVCRTAAALVVFLGAQTAIVEVGTSLRTPSYFDWSACTVRSACTRADLIYQYEAPVEAFPPWFLREE